MRIRVFGAGVYGRNIQLALRIEIKRAFQSKRGGFGQP